MMMMLSEARWSRRKDEEGVKEKEVLKQQNISGTKQEKNEEDQKNGIEI